MVGTTAQVSPWGRHSPTSWRSVAMVRTICGVTAEPIFGRRSAVTYPIGLFAARISRMIGTGAADDRFAEPRRDRGDAVRRRSQGGEKACRGGAPFPGTRPAG